MANPTYETGGTLLIPMSDFTAWASKFLPPGPYYTLSKPKEKGDNLEVTFVGTSVPPATP
jgi:hypothetical protein